MSVKEKMADVLDMPKEVLLNYPKMTVLGKKEVLVENIIGIIEFSDKMIRLNTQTHILKICGCDLFVRKLSNDGIELTGDVENIFFE